MSKNRAQSKTTGVIILVVVIFIAVLFGSVIIQVVKSPNFSGFIKEKIPDPVVTNVSGTNAAGDGKEGSSAYNWEDHQVFIVGDSLTEGAKKEIDKVIENATIDGKTSRGMGAGLSILTDWKESGILTDDAIIVVCLANNISDSTVRDAQQIVDMIEPGQSLIMMTGHGLKNMAPANEFIRSLPNVYSYVTVADWDLTILKSPSLLSDDGIHIAKNQGNTLYADLILRALEVAQPKPAE